MKNTVSLLFAARYFKAPKSTNAINIIAWISVIAIAVVTAALVIVFSVFNGFEDLVKGLYSDFYADIKISAASGKTIKADQQVLNAIQKTEGISAYSLIAEEKALITYNGNQTIVLVKGVDTNYTKVTALNQSSHIIRGSFHLGTVQQPYICLGANIENTLGVDVEKGLYPLTLFFPNSSVTNFSNENALHSFNAMPSGTFSVQQDFDNKYVFSNIDFVKYMLNMPDNTCTAIELKVKTADNPEKITNQLKKLFGPNYLVQTRYEQNQNLFATMQIEKWVIYAITCLILSVAAFNIIGALTMLVLEKQKDIAVLQAMGGTSNFIRQIFMFEGLLLALIGTGIGVGIGTLICVIQLKFHVIQLQGGSFIIDYYPVKMLLSDFGIIIATVFFIVAIASFFPSNKAAKQSFSLKS